MTNYREMDDVAEAIKNAKRRNKKCALLIGAGCSVTGGVPMAGGFVDRIKADWPTAYNRAAKASLPAGPGYPQCMAELADAERRDLIAEFVDKAKINWAHIAIAQLMKMGYVDRIFTTNFDPLVLRACALLNVFPAVYDFAASQRFKAAYLPERSVFHLHGQHTGFVLLHTREDVEQLSQSIEPLFEDAGRGRLWIVAGYSGENDPVFEHLAGVDRFDERLYWIGYKDNEPAPHVEQRLLNKHSSFFVKGYNADDFFSVLAQRLGCFPPVFVQKPFTHLTETLDTLTEYSPAGETGTIDIRLTARILISQAIKDLEEGPSRDTLLAERHLLAGDFHGVLALQSEKMDPQLAHMIAWAHVMLGNQAFEKARSPAGADADALYDQACSRYATALKIWPDQHEALYNWANAVVDRARIKTGDEADKLFRQAGELYQASVKIKPDKHQAFSNWGIALYDQAKSKSGEEADSLFRAAYEKYAAALAIKPDRHQTYFNWGIALADQARTKTGQDAGALFGQAYEKYQSALNISPDLHEVLNNWGNALADQAKLNSGAAGALYLQAGEKFAAALAIKPDKYESLSNWGFALADQARTKSGAEAGTLLTQACEKYKAAIDLHAEQFDTYNHWGIALFELARLKTGAEADELLQQAGQKYAAALKIRPDHIEPLNNWGNALTERGRLKEGAEADALFVEAGEKYAAAFRGAPDRDDTLNSWGNTLFYRARLKTGDEADSFFQQASEKYAAADALKPNLAAILGNWGNALADWGRTKTGAAAESLFQKASEKYAAADQATPADPTVLNNWALMLLYQAAHSGARDRPDLIQLAREKCLAAETAVPGSSSYNLACTASLLKDAPDCRRWLETAREQKTLPARAHLLTDTDLDFVRDQPWFQELLNTLG